MKDIHSFTCLIRFTFMLLFTVINLITKAQILNEYESLDKSYLAYLKSNYSDTQIKILLSKEIVANIPKRKQNFIRNAKDLTDYSFQKYSKDNGETGFKNKEGDIVIRAKFDQVSRFYINDKSNLKITTVKKKDVVRLINEKGQYVTDNKFSIINQGYSKYFRFYLQNFADDRWGILDYSGNVLTEPKFQKIILVATLQDSIETEIKLFLGVVNDKIGSYEFSIQENNNSVVQTIQEPHFDKLYDLTGQSIELPGFIYWHPDPSRFFYEPSIYVQKKANKYNLYCRSCNGKSFFANENYDSIAPVEVLIDDNKSQVELLLRVKKQNKWGIVNLNGNNQVENEYDMILPFKNGFAEIFKNSKKGIINKYGNILLNPDFDEINQFTRDLKLVKSTSKTGIVNNFYETIVTPEEGVEINLRQNLVYIKKEGKFGLITPSGNYIKPVYDSIGSFGPNSTAYVFQNNKQGIIDSEGKLLVPILFKSIEPFISQFYKVFDGKYYGLYSINGDKKTEVEFEEISLFEGGNYLSTRNGNNIGLLENGSCNVLFSTVYNTIIPFSNNKFIVSRQGKYGVYANEKKPFIPMEFDSIIPWGIDNHLIIGNQNKYQIAKIDPFEIFPTKYDFIDKLKENQSSVSLNKKWGIINQKCEVQIPLIYDSSFYFNNGIASVSLNGKVMKIKSNNEIYYNKFQNYKLSELIIDNSNILETLSDMYYGFIIMLKDYIKKDDSKKLFDTTRSIIISEFNKIIEGTLTESQKVELNNEFLAINDKFKNEFQQVITSNKDINISSKVSTLANSSYASCRLCSATFKHEGYSSRESRDGITIWAGKNGQRVEAPMLRRNLTNSASTTQQPPDLTAAYIGKLIQQNFEDPSGKKFNKRTQADYCSTYCAEEGAMKGWISSY